MLFSKEKKIKKMSLILLLVMVMIIPQATWASGNQGVNAISSVGADQQGENDVEEAPEVTKEPEATKEPEDTTEPEETKEPEVTETPPMEETPGVEEPPELTEVPEEATVTEGPVEETGGISLFQAKVAKKDTWVKAADGRWRYQYKNGKYATKKWENINGKWYYFAADTWMVTGWCNISDKWYYLDGDGAMVTGWFISNGQVYYLNTSKDAGVLGQMRTGWSSIGGNTYYFFSSGAAARGFTKLGGKTYYFKKSGGCGTKGKQLTGWHTISKKAFYFKKTGAIAIKGKLVTGWHTDSKNIYYLKKSGNNGTKGKMLLGWQKIKGKWYYFETTGKLASKGRALTGIRKINGKKYYFNAASGKGVRGRMETGWWTISGKRYYFYSEGHMATNTSINGIRLGANGVVAAGITTAVGGKTLKGFLQNAVRPVATTLYIWGGGHNDVVGGDARKYGLNANWKKFSNEQPSTYNYLNYQYAYGKGLDCSGYVGWAAYNTVNTKSNQETCTTMSTSTPKMYANRGWGSYKFTSAGSFKTGDVVSKNGHVWIVLGQCSDKSLVILHSTPHAGVQIAGTPDKNRSTNSQAVKLAQSYMKKYYGKFVSKFHLSSITDISYIYGPTAQGGLNLFRWDVTGKKMLSDPDGYMNMKPDQILKDLYNE